MKYKIELTEKELEVVILAMELAQTEEPRRVDKGKQWDLMWDTRVKIEKSYQQNPKYKGE